MKLDSPNLYYADRPVEHTAQGDIYSDIPFLRAAPARPEFRAAGARKRPHHREVSPYEPVDNDDYREFTFEGFGIVLHYTCGFTAQPPGTLGYSHDYRLMAPIVSLRTLKKWGLKNNELRKIRDGRIGGFM